MVQSNVTVLGKTEQASTEFLFGLVVFKCMCIVFGISGNIGVIIYNVLLNNDKSPTTWLIVNLSVSDLLVCLTFYPIWIIELIQILTGVYSDEEFFCKFIWSTSSVSIFLSILTLLAISFDRYLFIAFPLKYPILMTGQRLNFLVCAMWTWALVPLPLTVIYIGPGEVPGVCRSSNNLFLLMIIVYIFIPFSLIFFFNYKILKIARRQRKRMTTRYNQGTQAGDFNKNHAMRAGSFANLRNVSWQIMKKQLKPLKTFLIVIGVLLGCFIPYTVEVIIDKLVCNCIPITLHIIFSELIAVNSMINPFIYGVRHKKYRNAYGRILRILWNFLKFWK